MLPSVEVRGAESSSLSLYFKTSARGTTARWFAPIELEWDAYLSLTRQLQASRHMQEVYQSFAREAAAAMERAWAQ